jgi:hypothetical protein
VRAALGLEIAVGVRPFDRKRGTADASLVARCGLDDLGFEAVPLRPSHVHPYEHLRPVRGIRSADAGGDRKDRIAFVVRTAELRLEACLVDLGDQFLQLALEIGAERRIFGHRRELREIRRALAKCFPALDARAYQSEPLHDLLCALTIVPEVGRGGLDL